MDEILNIKISDLAKSNFAYIQLFQSYNIDFYCKGNATLKEALDNSGINSGAFLEVLKKINKETSKKYAVDVEEWPLDLLADFIQKTHHPFTDAVLVKLRTKVEDYLKNDLKNGDKIKEFKTPLDQLAQEMGAHMKREELILFPTIKRIVATRDKLEDPGEKTVRNPVDKMIHEHDVQFQLIKKIRNMLDDYALNSEYTIEYNEIISLMKDLDLDLSLHLHLENNILFPKAVELERSKLN